MATVINDGMLECTLEHFKDNYLPFTPSESHIQMAITTLTQAKILNRKKNGFGWVMGTKTSDKNQNVAFLVKICRDLEKASDSQANRPRAHFGLVHEPIHSSQPSVSGSKLDAYFYLKQGEDGKPTVPGLIHHIGVANVYNMTDDEVDVTQVLSNAILAMNDCPRRMFMFALTIVGSTTRVCYFSRFHSAISEPLDWKKSPKDFIHILLTFMFATPSELGFDPTVRRIIPPDGCQFFVYQLKDTQTAQTRAFRTLRLLSENHSPCISGGSTRVWRVQEVKSLDDPTPLRDSGVDGTLDGGVLKDVWIDEGIQTERQIRDKILEAFAERVEEGLEHDPAYQVLPDMLKEKLQSLINKPQDHFLTIACDSLGSTSTRPSNEFDQQTPTGHRDYPTKRQYRVVFEETCEALHSIASFRCSMQALQDAVVGLAIMFVARWVHRDISGGNILWYKGRGILGDLEHAMPFSSAASCAGLKIGTPHFMATEILKQRRLLYIPKDVVRKLLRSGDPFNLGLRSVKPHYLHDLESVWWFHLWTILQRVHHAPSHELGDSIFQYSLTPSPDRLDALTNPTWLLEQLARYVRPDFRSLVIPIDEVREKLYETYKHLHDLNDLAAYGSVYGALYNLCSKSMKIDLELLTFARPVDTATDLPEVTFRGACPNNISAPDSRPTTEGNNQRLKRRKL